MTLIAQELLCDGCGDTFRVEANETPWRHVRGDRMKCGRFDHLLHAIGVEVLHFCGETCRERLYDWLYEDSGYDRLQDFALELMREPGLEAARVSDSGPPAERIRRPPSLAQLARGIEPEPPLKPMGSQTEQDLPF